MDIAAVKRDEYSGMTYPYVYGSNFVGVVHHCGPTAAANYGIKRGTRVASITKWGSNSRHVSIPPERLMIIPKKLDACDVACLISAYLPAFQALHHGKSRPFRYSRTCLQGRRVFITGGATVESQALIRLAKLAGASEVYLAAPGEHHSIVEKKRAVPLHEDPDKWLPHIEGRMDVVVDYGFPRDFPSIRRALARRGRLVCVPQGNMSMLSGFLEQCELCTMKRASLFDFAEYVEMYREQLWDDMNHLLQLLSQRQIRPEIDRYISLKEIPAAHNEILTKAMTGTIICEPWKGY
jgi:NADPH:quinone reductase-like Zn-dependent oxidoreductase